MMILSRMLTLLPAVSVIIFFANQRGWEPGAEARQLAGHDTTSVASESALFPAGSSAPYKQPYAPADFETRCHGADVLVCEGFDSPQIFSAAKWPNSGLYPAADGALHGTFDTTVKSSGNGSLRFEIPATSSANAAGYWRQSFGRKFGEGTTFYVQFRQRFSKEMLKNDWHDTTWKQAIFHNGSATCGNVELTTGQFYHAGFPNMYTDCGNRGLRTNEGKPPTKLEQGDYNCWYAPVSYTHLTLPTNREV